tara:strand:- start:1304 stop:1810 length:507 start_codon:yes stop_codon:yes gene_type:complete
MKNTFFTPTHDSNGRKLSKAERKAANKAKHAASKAAAKKSSKKTTKAKLNPRKVEAVAEAFDFSYIDACARTYTPLPEEKSKPKRKAKKRKSKRLSHNDKLEAQAQRLSRGTAGTEPALTKEPSAMATSKPSANMAIFDLCEGDPVAAARHSAFLGMGLDAVTLDDIL